MDYEVKSFKALALNTSSTLVIRRLNPRYIDVPSASGEHRRVNSLAAFRRREEDSYQAGQQSPVEPARAPGMCGTFVPSPSVELIGQHVKVAVHELEGCRERGRQPEPTGRGEASGTESRSQKQDREKGQAVLGHVVNRTRPRP